MGRILLFVILNWVGFGGYNVILDMVDFWVFEFFWEFFWVVVFDVIIILFWFVDNFNFFVGVVDFVVIIILFCFVVDFFFFFGVVVMGFLVGIMCVFWLLWICCFGILFFIIMLSFGGMFFFFVGNLGKLGLVMVCVGMRVIVVVSIVVVLLGLVVMISVFVFEVVVLLMIGFVLLGYFGLFVIMSRFFVFSSGVVMLLNICIFVKLRWNSCIVKFCMMRFFLFILWRIMFLFCVCMIFLIIGMYGFCLLCLVWLKMWWILVNVWMVMKDNDVCIIIGDVMVVDLLIWLLKFEYELFLVLFILLYFEIW